MMKHLIEVLGHDTRLNLTSEEIADILWLAQLEWQSAEGAAAQLGAFSDLSTREDSEADVTLSESLGGIAESRLRSDDTAGLPPVGLQTKRAAVYDPEAPDLDIEDIPIAIADARSLRNTLGLLRALKPLLRKVASNRRQVINESATAQFIAATRLWLPVLEPEQEPWLDLALVVDASPSMMIWQRTVQDLKRLLQQSGAFRDVRLWSLDMADSPESCLLRPSYGPGADALPPSHYRELLDPTGRQLIWVMTDWVHHRWQTPVLGQVLKTWATHGPLAIIQVLPEWMWRRTHLRNMARVLLSSVEPGAANQALVVEQRSTWKFHSGPEIRLPVATLEPAVMESWCRLLIGQGEAMGVMLPEEATSLAAPNQSLAEPTAKERIETFRLFSSRLARRLAGLLSACPVVSLPIIRIVQEAMLPESEQHHVAEVLLGGILKPTQPLNQYAEPDAIDYVFYDREVQRQLLSQTPIHDTYDILSRWIHHRFNRSVDEFVAVLENPQADPALETKARQFAGLALEVLIRQGRTYAPVAEAYINRWLQNHCDCTLDDLTTELNTLATPAFLRTISPVAEIVIYVLRVKGGAYAEAATALRQWLQREVTRVATGGDLRLQSLTFKTARLIEEAFAPETTSLQTGIEDFTIATIELTDNGLDPFDITVATLIRADDEWTIQRRQSQAYRYIEQLAPDLLLEMVAIPAGSFMMGSPDDEPERDPREGPQHEVNVLAFFMGRYPVTQAQWRYVATELPQEHQEMNPDPSRFKGDRRPVESVSWDDAMEFCARLSTHTGREYRLPTEAEWEYACRAGTTTPFHFGETTYTEVANCGSTPYNNGPSGNRRGETTPVDHFEYANAWGLSDMHGNVFEWCLDHWHDSYEGAPSDGSAWLTENENSSRILRGGSWFNGPRNCRSACRYFATRDGRDDHGLGFRVVSVAPRALL